MSSGGLLPAGTGVDTGELLWKDKTPRWCRREHATTGADQTPGPRPVTLSSEGRPLLAVSGSLWGPARCVVACSLDSVWSLAIAGVQGTGACSRLSPSLPGPRGGRSHLPYTSTGLLRKQRHTTIRTVPSRHVLGLPSATQVAVRALLAVWERWGPLCSDPVSNSAVTGVLVAGRAVTCRRERSQTPPG